MLKLDGLPDQWTSKEGYNLLVLFFFCWLHITLYWIWLSFYTEFPWNLKLSVSIRLLEHTGLFKEIEMDKDFLS